MARYLRRTALYRLYPPAVLAPPAAPFLARPIQSKLAPSHGPGRPTVHLSQPAVVGPPIANYGPQRKLAPHPRQARATHYILRRPATLVAAPVPFIARAVRTNFGVAVRRAVEQHFVTSQLWSPEIINALPATFGPRTKLARTPRQARVTRSQLRPPATLGAAAAFTAPPLRTSFRVAVRRATERRREISKLRPPAVVGAIVVTRPVQVSYTVAVGRASRKRLGAFKLQPPAVVAPAPTPVPPPCHPSLTLVVDPHATLTSATPTRAALSGASSSRATLSPAAGSRHGLTEQPETRTTLTQKVCS